MMMTFYRGITVSPWDEGRVENILTNGLRVEDSRSWKGLECVNFSQKLRIFFIKGSHNENTRNSVIESDLESDSMKKSQPIYLVPQL